MAAAGRIISRVVSVNGRQANTAPAVVLVSKQRKPRHAERNQRPKRRAHPKKRLEGIRNHPFKSNLSEETRGEETREFGFVKDSMNTRERTMRQQGKVSSQGEEDV